jgi:hypothetical protein
LGRRKKGDETEKKKRSGTLNFMVEADQLVLNKNEKRWGGNL